MSDEFDDYADNDDDDLVEYDPELAQGSTAPPVLAAEPLFSGLLKRAIAQLDPADQVLQDFCQSSPDSAL